MKKVIFTVILTLLVTCGSVYSNPAIDALEQEIDTLRQDLPNIGIEGLIRMNKLREILHSLQRQEKDAEVIREWEESQKDRPCNKIFDIEGNECKRVNI